MTKQVGPKAEKAQKAHTEVNRLLFSIPVAALCFLGFRIFMHDLPKMVMGVLTQTATRGEINMTMLVVLTWFIVTGSAIMTFSTLDDNKATIESPEHISPNNWRMWALTLAWTILGIVCFVIPGFRHLWLVFGWLVGLGMLILLAATSPIDPEDEEASTRDDSDDA